MGACCDSCCGLPDSTEIDIKICFHRGSLDSCFGEVKQPIPDASASFTLQTWLGTNYFEFIEQTGYVLSNILALKKQTKHVLMYESNRRFGLQKYRIPPHIEKRKITFGWLMYRLPFIDWSTGYSLIVWFDSTLFETCLDIAIDSGNMERVSQIFGILTEGKQPTLPSTMPSVTTNAITAKGGMQSKSKSKAVVSGGKYVSLEGAPNALECNEEITTDDISDIKNGDFDRYYYANECMALNEYCFRLSAEDIRALLRINRTQFVAQYLTVTPQLIDWKMIVGCVENRHFASLRALVNTDCAAIYTLSPFHAVATHAKRFNGIVCRRLGQFGLFTVDARFYARECGVRYALIGDPKVRALLRNELKADENKLELIRAGVEERRMVFDSCFGGNDVIVRLVELFESGEWAIFYDIANNVTHR